MHVTWHVVTVHHSLVVPGQQRQKNMAPGLPALRITTQVILQEAAGLFLTEKKILTVKHFGSGGLTYTKT